MTFDAPLFDEAVPAEAANIGFHLRTVAVVGKAGEIVCRHHAELAQVGECTNLRFAQRVFPVPTAIDRTRAVETAAGLSGIRFPLTFRLALLSVPPLSLIGPLHQVGPGLPVPSSRECKVGNAIGTVHEETPFGHFGEKAGIDFE